MTPKKKEKTRKMLFLPKFNVNLFKTINFYFHNCENNQLLAYITCLAAVI